LHTYWKKILSKWLMTKAKKYISHIQKNCFRNWWRNFFLFVFMRWTKTCSFFN
jgi:hypothetical protein